MCTQIFILQFCLLRWSRNKIVFVAKSPLKEPRLLKKCQCLVRAGKVQDGGNNTRKCSKNDKEYIGRYMKNGWIDRWYKEINRYIHTYMVKYTDNTDKLEKRKIFIVKESQIISIRRMIELENHHLVKIIKVVGESLRTNIIHT